MKYELDLYDKWNEGRVEGIKEGMEIGQARGRQEGIQQGREEGAIEVAVSMLKDNFETGNHCTVYEFVYRNYQIFGKVSFVQSFFYLISVSSTNFP